MARPKVKPSLRDQVEAQRARVRAGQLRADTGDVLAGTKPRVKPKPDAKAGLRASMQSVASNARSSRLETAHDRHKREVKDPKRSEAANAPALAVLNETLRTVRASAGAADELVQGRPSHVPGAVKRGLIDNKGPLYSDVLKHAGAPKGVAAVGGLALDIALDPTTYLTGGTSVAARGAAKGAAQKATAEALKAGATKKAADRAGRAAASRALADPRLQNKGLTVGVRAKVPFTKKPQIDVQTSGRTTAAISRKVGASKVATRVRASGPAQGVGRSLAPDFRPTGVDAREFTGSREAERKLRAARATDRAQHDRELAALRKAIPDQQTATRIIDHIESGRPLRELGDLAETARTIRQMTGEAFDAKRARNLLRTVYRAEPGDAARYIPRVRRIDFEPPKRGVRVGKAKVAVEHRRTFREPLAALRESNPGLFSEDLPALVANAGLKARQKASLADFWAKVAKSGRPLQRDSAIDLEREIVARVTPRGLVPLLKENGRRADRTAIAKALKNPSGYVILNRENYERLANATADTRTGAGKAFDKLQGAWKTVVTVPMPGYHARNLIGDTHNAWMADTTAAAFKQSGKVLKSRAARNKAERKAPRVADTSAKITIAGRTMTHRQLLAEAERNGAIGQGFIARELPYEAQRAPGKLSRAVQYREDLPRLATYISARERGATPSQAAEWTNKHHFDYGDLTDFERKVARRAIPFWTFFARNSRLQATKILTRPGKAATLQKVMEEAAKAAGFKDYESYAENLPDYQQRGLPIPLKLGGKVTTWLYAPPATDLNALSVNPSDMVQNVAQRLTAAKLVVELYANYSVFFQGAIEQEGAKLVPAPAILGDLPGNIRKQMGIAKYKDKRRGVIWGWPAKVDYIARQLPESSLLVQSLTPVPGSRNQTKTQALVGATVGFKPSTYSAVVEDEGIRREAKKLHELTVRRDNLLRQPEAQDEFGFASPELVGLRAQIKAQQEKVDRLKTTRGDATDEASVENPPLQPGEELRQRLERQRDEMKGQGTALRKRLDRQRREFDYLRAHR